MSRTVESAALELEAAGLGTRGTVTGPLMAGSLRLLGASNRMQGASSGTAKGWASYRALPTRGQLELDHAGRAFSSTMLRLSCSSSTACACILHLALRTFRTRARARARCKLGARRRRLAPPFGRSCSRSHRACSDQKEAPILFASSRCASSSSCAAWLGFGLG